MLEITIPNEPPHGSVVLSKAGLAWQRLDGFAASGGAPCKRWFAVGRYKGYSWKELLETTVNFPPLSTEESTSKTGTTMRTSQ